MQDSVAMSTEQSTRPLTERLTAWRLGMRPYAFRKLGETVGCTREYCYFMERGMRPGAALAARIDAALTAHGF